MRRRDFIKASSVSAASWPFAAHAQSVQIRRVGALILGNADADAFRSEMREGLLKAGYVEGRDVLFDVRSAQGRLDLLPQLAAELVAAKSMCSSRFTHCVRVRHSKRPVIFLLLRSSPILSKQGSSQAWRGLAETSRACR
jgi:hypothetical protein